MDEELLWIKDIKNGRKEEFNKIINKYHKKILNYFYRWTFNKEDAEDLTQELFSRVFYNLNIYNTKYNFSTWIYKIAYNLAIDFKRASKYKPILSFNGDSNEEKIIKEQIINLEHEKITKIPEQLQMRGKIRKAFLNLPKNQSMALILKIYEEKNYDEIAEIMDISKSAVETLLFRARENLKKELNFIQ